MGFAMRRVRLFPMVLVGLASIGGLAALDSPCRAWEGLPSAVLKDPSYSKPMDPRHVDSAVQQAGYYDSRRKPTAAPPSGNSIPTNGMYRGQKVKLPTFFNRKTASAPGATAPQSNMPPAAMGSAVRGGASMNPQAVAGARQMPQGMPLGTPTAGYAAGSNARIADGRPVPPAPIRQGMQQGSAQTPTARNARPNVVSPAVPNSSPVPPWSNSPPGAPNARRTASATVQAAKPQLSPADQLIAQAHELSTRAETEEDYTQIIETCRRAQAAQASSATSQYVSSLLAWSYNRRGQIKAESCREKDAIVDFDEAVKLDESCWRALHNRGVLLAQDGVFDKAFEDFSRTIELNPSFAKAYSNRAALFTVANKLDDALADYDRAIELDGKLAVAHRGCGRVCQLLGKVDDAIKHYDIAVELAPNDAFAAACRADLLTDIGRYTEAVAEYDRAIEIDPNSHQAQGGSAWLLATCPDSSVRDPELAIERAQTVIGHGGENDAVNFDTLGAAQASAGHFDAAIESIKRAIALAPDEERPAYEQRLSLYESAKPYRISPMDFELEQASYEATDAE
jgi:tetratricopeptide (TPR) repeat protein